MKLDNYNLLIDDNGDISNSAYNTALFFIKSKFKKEEVDTAFRIQYPVRNRRSDEALEEYDDYLTRHTQAYEEWLNKQNLGYLMHLDINLDYALQTLGRSANGFIVHPDLPTTFLNKTQALMMSAAIMLYNFGLGNLNKCLIDDVHSKSLMTMRKSKWRYLSDLKLLFGTLLTKDAELVTILKEISRRYSPTFITKMF